MNCLFLRPDVWCFWLPVFYPTAPWLFALHRFRSFLFNKVTVLPPRVLLNNDFFLNSLIPHILIEHLQYGQGIVLSTENKGDENCHEFITKPKCIFMSTLLLRFQVIVLTNEQEENAFIWKRLFCFPRILSTGRLHFPAIWEIYKHQTFIFISTRGQCVTIRFFSSSKSAKCIDFLNLKLIIL